MGLRTIKYIFFHLTLALLIISQLSIQACELKMREIYLLLLFDKLGLKNLSLTHICTENVMEPRAGDEDHHLVLDIDQKLHDLSPIPLERSIFRVHHALRNINVKAYEPQVIAIGPYHHAKDEKKAHLRPMEEHKLLYLKQLLHRTNETTAQRYIVALQQSEERARTFYAKHIILGTNEFVEMMLLDGCFIIEFLRKNMKYDQSTDNDPIFQLSHIRPGLRRDLQLFENQLPLFVLVKLFDMTKEGSKDIINMALNFFKIIAPRDQRTTNNGLKNIEELPHLLSLLHNYFCYPFKESLSKRNGGQEENNKRLIESATKLKEAGVKFKKAKGRSLFDIRFQNGTMEIPTLVVDDHAESLFRNYIAYEHYLPNSHDKYFTNYRRVIDYLVNSSKDVEILCHLGIVSNHLGDEEVVSSMVNKLGHNVTVDNRSFDECYSKLFNEVNKHCSRRWNRWLAKLRRDYFNSPWALISFAAAFLLLLLTATQTVFSILSAVSTHYGH